MESGPWLHEGQPRLHELLRGAVRRAFQKRSGTSVRARVRPTARAGHAESTSCVAAPSANLRELDERPLSHGRAGRVHRSRRPGDAAGGLAHVPGTKRHYRMQRLLSGDLRWMGALPNVWFGVSVENRHHGFPRLAALRRTPAAVRFVSVEPLLEDLGAVDLAGIHWVIAGGESGPRARAMRVEWIVDLERECRRQRVPFFFKQWGGVRKHAAGRTLNGRTYDALPAAP